jgi:hypothetical protein
MKRWILSPKWPIRSCRAELAPPLLPRQSIRDRSAGENFPFCTIKGSLLSIKKYYIKSNNRLFLGVFPAPRARMRRIDRLKSPWKWKTLHLCLPDLPRSSLSLEFPSDFLIFFARIHRWAKRPPSMLRSIRDGEFSRKLLSNKRGHTDRQSSAEITFLPRKSLNFDFILAPFYNFILTLLPVLLY